MLIHLFRPDPKRTWKERLASMKSKVLLILESVLVTALITTGWYFVLWQNGLRFPHKAEVIISTLILVQLGLLGFIAAVTTIKVVDRSADLSKFIRQGDEKGFMTIRDIRIPMRMHIVFGALAFGMLALIYTFGYETVWEGLLGVFVTTFSLVIYFSVTMELQDPHRSTWFKTTAPEDWLTQDAEEYFEKLNKKKPCK